MLQDLHDHLTPQRQAHIYATGLLTIMTLGTLALIVVCLTALWLVMQLALALMTTIVASCNELASAFTGADPLVKLVLFCALAFIAYGLVRKVWRS